MNNYTIKQILSLQQLEKLLEAHVQISGMACGLMDNDQNIIVGAGLQQVCTQFLWEHPDSFARCWRNDPTIKQELQAFSGDLFECRCQNGMVNIAMPITVEGNRLGIFFSGQFFYDDQPPDLAWFQQQANELKFDLELYLAAVGQAPVLSRSTVDTTMRFLHQLVQMLAETGYTNLLRLRKQEELKQANQQLNLLNFALNQVREAIFLKDVEEGKFLYVNQEACRSLGYSKDELIGMSALAINPTLSAESFKKLGAELLKQGSKTFESTHQTKSGTLLPVEISTTIFAYDDTHYSFALVRDITERRQAEQQIKLLNHALDNVHEGAFLIDLQGRFLYVNQEACRSLGYTRNELCGMGILDINPDYSLDMLAELIADELKQGALTFETRHRTRDGQIFPVEVSSSVFAYGDSSYLLSLVRDITERKQAEEALREREQQFRTLAENLPDNIIRYDNNCCVHYINPQLERTLGKAAISITGKTPVESSGETFREYQNKVRQVITTGENTEIDLIIPDTGKGERLHEIRFIAEHAADGNVSGVLAIGRDITERKQAEKERLATLHFLSCMERINRAIQLSCDLEQMMSDVLDVVLSIFDCDRAYLLYPCDPDAKSWQIPMERTTAEYPGSKDIELVAASNDWIAKKLRLLLYSSGALRLGIGTPFPLSGDLVDRLGIKNILATAIYPKTGQPWEFGIHQCTHTRTWSPAEKQLFQEIGRRLTDGMTGLLIQRNLQESEQRYRMVFENSPVSIWEEDFSGIKLFFDQLRSEGIVSLEEYLDQHPEQISSCAAQVKVINVNQATLALHGAIDRQELLEGLLKTFTPESLVTFRQELLELWQGKTQMRLDSTVKTLSGEPRQVTVYASVCPGYEATLGKCVVSLVDITDRKRAEQEVREKQQHLNDLMLELTLSEERERRRIAVDLHDTLGQDLTLTRMKLGTLHKTTLSTEQGTLISDIKGLTDDAISRVRSLTRLLCPSVLDGAGLEAALKWLARQIEADYHLQITFSDDLQEKQVGKELQIELYSSVRELLINVAKHARTDTVCLSLFREADTLAIRVEDDGIGFDVDATLEHPGNGGFGLFTISRRISLMGGRFHITSKPDIGTEVAINIPLLKQAPPDTRAGEQP